MNAASERAGFDAVVDAFWDPIMRYFWRSVPSHEAEELAQRTFISAYRATRLNAPEQHDQAGWRRYLFTCAKHLWIDHVRSRRTTMPLLDDVMPAEPALADSGSLTEVLRDEEFAGLRECLDGLEPQARSTCMLHFFDGLSKREIGRLLDRPESTVRNLLVKALSLLRRCLSTKGLAPESPPSAASPTSE